MSLTFMEGNEAIGWGAAAAGCDFFAGYPITPATTIYNTMLKILPPQGGVCLQGEDEIASIGFCLGASMAGRKVLTATAGPGISLYSENISFAIGSEIPIVIVNVQRLGPSTGSATKAADGDIQFMRWGNSGGLPVIVLAPADVKDCYVLTMQAFNLAEQFRCPVFVAASKEVSMTRETIDLEALTTPSPINRKTAAPDKPFKPFGVSGDSLTPDFLPIGDQRLVRQTSSTHGPEGYITTDSGQIADSQQRLDQKLNSAVGRFSFHAAIDNDDADTLVIVYGVTARAAKQVVDEINTNGGAVSLLALKTLWPVPEQLIRDKARTHRRIVVIEMNMGQYVREVERVLGDKKIEFYGQMDGDLIAPAKIKEVITNG